MSVQSPSLFKLQFFWLSVAWVALFQMDLTESYFRIVCNGPPGESDSKFFNNFQSGSGHFHGPPLAKKIFYHDALPNVFFFFFVSDYSTNLFTSSITPLWSTPSGLKKNMNLAFRHMINAIHRGNPLKKGGREKKAISSFEKLCETRSLELI